MPSAMTGIFNPSKLELGKGFGEPLPPTPVVLQFEEKKNQLLRRKKMEKKKKNTKLQYHIIDLGLIRMPT